MNYTHSAIYTGGQWHAPAGRRSAPVISPATEERIGTIPLSSPQDVDRAVASARTALQTPEWGQLTTAERSDLLERFAEELEKNLDTRAELTSVQNGMPISTAVPAEGHGPPGLLRYYAAIARATPIEEPRARLDGLGGQTLVRRTPVGVVAAIVPWNFPQALTMFKLAPALAAGCTVVLKPAPETTLDALELAAAGERAGLPAGVLNVVTGGADIGSYMVSHPGVDKVAFTGSTAAGLQIGEACGKLLRPTTLELGGKSAAIVLDDADLDTMVQSLARDSLRNSGQTCYACTRILAPSSRHSEVLEAVASFAGSLTIGDPLDPATQIGPLVSERQRNRVEKYIELGISSGATLATGGQRPDQERGWYVEPTVFGGVDSDSEIARDEIFGPVLSVIPYHDLEDAVAIANNSDYGLGGMIWTSDVDKGLDIARRVETGSVGINFFELDAGAPFGGVKNSGLGHELGPEGLASYFQLKSIFLPA